MSNDPSALNYSITPIFGKGYFTALLSFIGFVIIVMLTFSILPILIPLFSICSRVTFSLIIGCLGVSGSVWYLRWRSNKLVKSLVNKKHPPNLDEHHRIHHAIVIIHSYDFFTPRYPLLDNLIKGFIRRKIPFKIYDCNNENEFKEILMNKNANFLWIFGHGWHGGVTWKWKTYLKIGPLKNHKTNFAYFMINAEKDAYPKKAFIGQFHCNDKLEGCPCDTPLISILLLPPLDPTRYFISDGKMNSITIWYFTRRLLKIPFQKNEGA